LAAERGREGREAAGCGGDCVVAPGQLGSERKKKGKGEGRLTRGAQVSASRGKRKKGEEERWAGAGFGRRAAEPSGLKGEPAMFSFFSFSFSFSTSFSNHFSFQIQIKLFKLFSRIL
jgi:hypothetical protein